MGWERQTSVSNKKNVNLMVGWRRVATRRRLDPGTGLTGLGESVPGSAHGGVVRACRSSVPMLFVIFVYYPVENMRSEVGNDAFHRSYSGICVDCASDLSDGGGAGRGG